jgi:hypothetical protein
MREISAETRAFVGDLVDARIAGLARITAWQAFDVGVAMALMRAERGALIDAVIEAFGSKPVLDDAVRRVVTEAIEIAASVKH